MEGVPHWKREAVLLRESIWAMKASLPKTEDDEDDDDDVDNKDESRVKFIFKTLNPTSEFFLIPIPKRMRKGHLGCGGVGCPGVDGLMAW